MKIARLGQNTAAIHQRGVAAIEFALVFTVLFMVLYGIATFGAVFYMQQVVSRAAEDGARVASSLPTGLVTNDPRIKNIKDAVYDSLASALIVPMANNGGQSNRRQWIVDNIKEPVVFRNGNSVVITVTYPYNDATRLLPSLPLVSTDTWMPKELTSQATAATQS